MDAYAKRLWIPALIRVPVGAIECKQPGCGTQWVRFTVDISKSVTYTLTLERWTFERASTKCVYEACDAWWLHGQSVISYCLIWDCAWLRLKMALHNKKIDLLYFFPILAQNHVSTDNQAKLSCSRPPSIQFFAFTQAGLKQVLIQQPPTMGRARLRRLEEFMNQMQRNSSWMDHICYELYCAIPFTFSFCFPVQLQS